MDPSTGRDDSPGDGQPGVMGGLQGVSQPPTLGLLTRTLVPSSLHRWIIPARIRHEKKNDVVFVRDGAIEIKEFIGDALQDVLVKDDFGATIRAARIMGHALQPVRDIAPIGLDEIIKEEGLDDAAADLMDIDRHTNPTVPPQILVLTLQSGRKDTLLFLFGPYSPSDPMSFVSFQHPLSYQENELDRLGKNIAVDPSSRALAVAATSERLMVYVLKTMAQIREEVESPQGLVHDKFVPIASERHLELHGTILKMEFLQPPREDEDHIILLLVVATEKDTKFYRLEWDCLKGLDSLKLTPGPSLGAHGRCPLHLIPFTITTGFILICENYQAVYYNILDAGMIANRLHDQNQNQDMKEPGSLKRLPLFTAWARPLRREDWALTNDAFFLCREDGLVIFLEFDRNSLPKFLRSGVGDMHISVDTGFAVLHPGAEGLDDANRSYDTLVAAGDMSYGSLMKFESRQDGVIDHLIPNWAPMLDYCTARVGPFREFELKKSPPATEIPSPERLFGCFGRGQEHGAVCEIQYGLEARSIGSCIIETGVIGMWVLPDVSDTVHSVCILMAEPDNTSSLLRVRSDPGGDTDVVPVEELCGIDLESSTLAAGSTVSGIIIQITKHSLRAFNPIIRCQLVYHFDGEVTKLGYVEGHSSAILIATVSDILHYAELEIRNQSLYLNSTIGTQNHFQLPAESSCIFLLKTTKLTYAFVGTATRQLHVFTVSFGNGFNLVATHNFTQEFEICDSIAVISGEFGTLSQIRLVILCGLRNGSIHTLFMNIENSEAPVLETGETLNVGRTSVTIKSDTSFYSVHSLLCSRAFIHSAETFCCLSYDSSRGGACSATLQSVWLTEPAEADFRQSSLSSIAQSDPWNSDPYGAAPNLYLVDMSQLYLAQMLDGLRSHPIIRRIPVPGTPSRIMFSNQVNKLIVAHTKIKLRERRRTSGQVPKPKKRLLYPSLSFFDLGQKAPDEVEGRMFDPARPMNNIPNTIPRGTSKVIGPSGMKVLGLIEWNPSMEGKAFPLLTIYGSRARKSPRSDTGVIYLYKIGRSGSSSLTLELKQTIPCEEPVYSLGTYGASSLIFCSGKTLYVKTMTIVEGALRWVPAITYELRSFGIHLSVREPFVYVTTSQDSVSVFRVEANALVPQCSDEAGRSGSYHLLLPEHSLVLASDTGSTVRGLWQAPAPPINNSFRTLFEAVLPGRIRKLSRAAINPPWLTKYDVDHSAIVGSGMDGSLYQFHVVDEAKWRLLRFLQHMAERNAIVCPFTYSERPKRHIEPTMKQMFYMHIDGDILARILERGIPDPRTLVQTMLQQEPNSKQRDRDFDTWRARERRFLDVVDTALGDLGGQDHVEAVVDYLRLILRPSS